MEGKRNTTMPDGHQETVARVQAAMTRRSLKQTDVARQTGLSAPVISAVLSGSYRGRSATVLEQLDRWAAGLDDADKLNVGVQRARDFVETPTALKIDDLCGFARARAVIGIAAGATGIGKSMTLKQHAAANPLVWYCRFSRAHSTIAKVVRHVAGAVGVANSSSRDTTALKAIADRIRRTRGLLILDEAQHLSKDGLETIREIYDDSEDDGGRTIGLVLAGHLNLADKVALLDHLDGRVGRRLLLSSATEADADALADHWRITCPRARDFLRGHARGRAGLRRLVRLYEYALTFAARDGGEVGLDHLRKAAMAFSGSAAN